MAEKESDKKNGAIKSLAIRLKLFFKKSAGGEFYGSKIILWLLALSFFANIANWAILAIFIHSVDAGIILHYNVYFGVDNMGDWREVYIMPVIGLVLFIINWLLAIYFYKRKERIASHVLLISSFMAQMSLIIASISVIIINY